MRPTGILREYVSVYANEGALRTGGYQSRTFEQQILQSLSKVTDLVSFVEEVHFDLRTLHLFWRNDTRAHFTVQTIGRLLGRPLSDELHSIKEMLERAVLHSLPDFSRAVAPDLFNLVHELRPVAEIVEDKRASVEQLHYAADLRQAVLQHVLTVLNERYQAPRFRDLSEASHWTDAYATNLHWAEQVIRGTREILKTEMAAAEAYLRQTQRDIEVIEAAAEAKFGIVKRLRWVSTLEEAETSIHNLLAERAEQMESLAFAMLTETKSPGFLTMLAQQTLRKAPRLALVLLGVAGTGAAAQAAQAGEFGKLSLTLPQLPQPLRSLASHADTSRFVALRNGAPASRVGQYLSKDVQQLVTDVRAREQAATQHPQPQNQIDRFFEELSGTTGRQTVVIGTRAELVNLLNRLAEYGYAKQGVLTLLKLDSVEAFSRPLTLDLRDGRIPMLFPQSAETHATAPQAAIQQAEVTAPIVAIAGTSETVAPTNITATAEHPTLQTSSQAAVNPGDGFIVYRVQPNETLDAIAARYGLSVNQIIADNNLAQEVLSYGQHLLIRRPNASQGGEVSRYSSPNVASDGSFGGAADAAPAEQGMTPRLRAPVQGQAIIARYGETLFPSLEEMPSDAQSYFVGTVQEVADFFGVRPGDIMGILRLEQNDAGWRLQELRTSSAGATGVAQIVTRTWNGWANPEHAEYVRNVADIEEHGGLGFDWAARDEWRAWQQGEVDRSALEGSDADPAIFENSVAAVARHLVHWGLTEEFAEQDPQGFAARLADAIAVYNSGRTLDVSANWVQSDENSTTTAQYVEQAMATAEQVSSVVSQPSIAVALPDATERYAELLKLLYDQSLGVMLADNELELALAGNPALLEEVTAGRMEPEVAAAQMLEQMEQLYIAEGRAALRGGRERPWPYVHNYETLYAQKSAVSLLGRTLTLNEMDGLMHRSGGDRSAIRQELVSRTDARLFMQAKHLFGQMLDRSGRGLPVYNSEVLAVVQPLLAGRNIADINDMALQLLSDQLQATIESLDEYKQLNSSSSGKFEAAPLMPMPRVFKGFGAAVDYQAGGRHTGVDLANPRTSDGKEPPIYAVGDATVVHVGPLYCDTPNACRGGRAIVLDHGNQIYSIYSHNSEAEVQVGQQVEAGQRIGRQGNEGYSFGSHLHFEVHTGAPFTGDWQQPFDSGEFVDPSEWLPES